MANLTLDETIENLRHDFEIDMYIRDIAPQVAEWLEQLKAFKDAQEQGLLKIFPCEVDDTVYFPVYDKYDSAVITKIEIDKQGITFYWAQYEVGVDCTELWDDGCFSIEEIGKTVFLTREEAKAKLKETQKG